MRAGARIGVYKPRRRVSCSAGPIFLLPVPFFSFRAKDGRTTEQNARLVDRLLLAHGDPFSGRMMDGCGSRDGHQLIILLPSALGEICTFDSSEGEISVCAAERTLE